MRRQPLKKPEIATLHDIFRQGAAQGQTFFVASGDAGAYDCGDTSFLSDLPANQPSVVSVGGTTLLLSKESTYGSESTWSTIEGTQLSGGGGGLSTFFPGPAYQETISRLSHLNGCCRMSQQTPIHPQVTPSIVVAVIPASVRVGLPWVAPVPLPPYGREWLLTLIIT